MIFEALARARQQLDDAGRAYSRVEVGAMIEVPAAALMIDRFLQHFDFVSIGTNDLIQYTLAIDRADEAVAHLYDPWHPAVLQLLHHTIARANAHGARASASAARWPATPPSPSCCWPWACAASRCTRRASPSIKQRVLRADTRQLASHLRAGAGVRRPRRGAASGAAGVRIAH